jgi:hypothetical protein
MTTDPNLSGDELLKEALRLQQASGQTSFDRKKKQDQSSFNRVREDVMEVTGFFNQAAQGVKWIYENALKPFALKVGGPVGIWAAKHYKNDIWDRFVYAKDQYDAPYFSKKRAAGVLTATFLALALVPTAATLTVDTGLYALTAHQNETIYLTDSNEIYPDKNIHSVKGCYELPCEESNSIYFRVEPRLFNHAWSLLNRNDFFYPDYVANAVPPGINQCEATSYGIRFKPLVMNTDIYPDLLAAKCQPINVDGVGHAQPSWTMTAPTTVAVPAPAP